MAFATAKMYWLNQHDQELHLQVNVPSVLWCNNIGALSLVSNHAFHARMEHKHIKVYYHFVREKAVHKDI